MRATAFKLYSGVIAVLGFTAAAPLSAQRELFSWTGRVDQQILLTMSGREVTATNIGPSEPGQLGVNVLSPIPHRDGDVTVTMLEGRGDVEVLRQPSAENGYTTVIRIRDPQGGAGFYRLEADWEPAAAGEIGPPLDRESMGDYDRHVALRWSGDVDGDLEIVLSPNRVSYHAMNGLEPQIKESTLKGIPDGATGVRVMQRDGRDRVVVTQQPSPENGNTAILRIHDYQAGYNHYSFDVLWQ